MKNIEFCRYMNHIVDYFTNMVFIYKLIFVHKRNFHDMCLKPTKKPRKMPFLAAFGRSWAALGRSWPLLGRSWPLLAALGALLARSWSH